MTWRDTEEKWRRQILHLNMIVMQKYKHVSLVFARADPEGGDMGSGPNPPPEKS